MMSNGHSNSSKSLERFISRRALQMGSSAPCKTWALGFFCGVCIVYLFGVALPPIQILMIRSVHPPVRRAILLNSTSTEPGGATETDDLSVLQEKIEIATNSKDINEADKMHLYNAWSTLLDTTSDEVMKSSDVPRPPHLENCRLKWERNKKFDSYSDNGVFPPWTLWKGSLGLELFNQNYSDSEEWRQMFFSDPSLRFLYADWERLPGFGIGAQLAGMSGLLAIAIKERRILVAGYYNRADHNGCQGLARSSWSCYFLPETSADCQKRALDLMQSKDSRENGIIKVKENYTSKQIWAGHIPRYHFDALALRYLMRFQSEYMCRLLNVARHSAFGMQAAKMVLENVPDPPKPSISRTESDIERLVWSEHKPYIPGPLISMHEVIDETKLYPKWNFYFTNVTRQDVNVSMAMYEASLGRETSTNYPLVNFIMATEADFFIGALGSTWCYLIDGMRNTAGKVMSGYLSVNKDRFCSSE
uniref:Fucosyltransferase n=1 Tax=Oryza nivara TaxID=4536 RepID=A0A0E0GEM6_ORYNI